MKLSCSVMLMTNTLEMMDFMKTLIINTSVRICTALASKGYLLCRCWISVQSAYSKGMENGRSVDQPSPLTGFTYYKRQLTVRYMR